MFDSGWVTTLILVVAALTVAVGIVALLQGN